MSTTLTRAAARLLVVPVAASALLAAPAPASHAEVRSAGTTITTAGLAADDTTQARLDTRRDVRARRAAYRARLGNRAVAKARTRAGSPYVWGATGPHAFDCSGLTQWVYRKLGKHLPRTSGAQAGAVHRVRHPRRGDLVFFTSGSHVYHVGIYAGHHMLWHASRPGHPVAKEHIWTSSVFYGRVR